SRLPAVQSSTGLTLGLAVRLGVAVLAEAAVALDGAPARDHHLPVLLLAHAGHAAGHLLEAPAVGGADLGEEVDVAAELDAAVEIACQHRLPLRLAHRPLVEIG